MNNFIQNGTISHEEKAEIFQKFAVVLLKDRVDFNITNYFGDIVGTSLSAPSIGIRALDLEMDSKLSNSDLMLHTDAHSCMINSFEQLMQEYAKLRRGKFTGSSTLPNVSMKK